MKRRTFVAILAASAAQIVLRSSALALLGAAALSPLAVRAQQSVLPVIGFLNQSSATGYALHVEAFRQGLKEAGYIEGQNCAIDYAWANDRMDRLPVLAAELVKRPVSVIAAAGLGAALAAKAATTSIPIVFETSGDPVKFGLVASLNRPGGNVTGITPLSSELIAKRVGLLHELLPTAKIIALLVDPTAPRSATEPRDIEQAARALGLQSRILIASTESEIEAAFAGLNSLRADALMVGSGTFFVGRREQIVALAARYRVPTVYQQRESVAAGGLMSYGGSLTESYRLAGTYTGKVLKGEKPADLPVQQATRLEFVLNLKATKALGLDISPNLLALVDEVIE
jgi:putative tryptophan/tyrosine transport system substrate-binding protein